ncbi:MAG TPA: hypothetical protein VHI93_06200 [Candidatus Thermoplasmatota archaeon]|nr:hypothetical protein [Candidatus Thermoplasmatota archaeon]
MAPPSLIAPLQPVPSSLRGADRAAAHALRSLAWTLLGVGALVLVLGGGQALWSPSAAAGSLVATALGVGACALLLLGVAKVWQGWIGGRRGAWLHAGVVGLLAGALGAWGAFNLAEELDAADLAFATTPLANNDILWGVPALALLAAALVLLPAVALSRLRPVAAAS